MVLGRIVFTTIYAVTFGGKGCFPVSHRHFSLLLLLYSAWIEGLALIDPLYHIQIISQEFRKAELQDSCASAVRLITG